MTEPNEESGSTPESGAEDESLDGVKDLLKNALDRSEPPEIDVLAGVQRKLRQRSRGKFYADGWSTAKQPPVATYFVTALVMLAIVLIAYAILAPLSGQSRVIDTEPKPVQVMPPR